MASGKTSVFAALQEHFDFFPISSSFFARAAEHHRNRQGALHGGLTATLMDAACGYAGLHAPEGEPQIHGLTAMLNICYLAPAFDGEVTALGRVRRGGKSLYFAEAELHSAQGVLPATAQGTFKRPRVHSRSA